MRHHVAGHKLTQKALTDWANAKYETSVSAMSIGKVLKKKEFLCKQDVGQFGEKRRLKKVQCPPVEDATFKWIIAMIEKGAILSDDLIIAAAQRFYYLIERDSSEKEHLFSASWVFGFKKRFNIKSYVRHGEDISADNSTEVFARMEEIKDIVTSYDREDVFNMDETGLFYKLEPNRTLATSRLSGKKKQKERITLALTMSFLFWSCLLLHK